MYLEMPHIHTGEGEHDFTVSGFIIRTDGVEPRILLHHHKKLRRWLQFGGHVELNEQLWTALAHELEEESGYSLPQLQVLLPRVEQPDYEDNSFITAHPPPAHINTHDFDNQGQHFHTDIEYVLTTEEEPCSAVAKNESSTLSLFTADQLAALPNSEIPPNVRKIGLFAILISQSDNWQAVPATDFSF